jgi:hypothetical protein
MPLAPAPATPVPANWTIFGHSYWQLAFGTRTQQGRLDGYFRNLLDVQQGLNVQNHSQAGSALINSGAGSSYMGLADYSFGRVLQLVRGAGSTVSAVGSVSAGYQGYPYVVGGWGGSGGAYLLGWGINDLGFNGNTPQFNTAYQHCLRAVISRCRIATMGSTGNNTGMWQGGTGTWANSAGWGFSSQPQWSTSGANMLVSTTTGSTLTITLPADYAGETVACLFGASASNGIVGGTSNVITISGTAGLTGTFNTDNLMPSGTGNNIVVCKRFTTLTPAAASKTIIFTFTTAGSSTAMLFDSWWLEADDAPPVIVCNTARLCDNPYNPYPTVKNAAFNGGGGYTTYQNTFTTTSITGGTTTVAACPSSLALTTIGLGLPTAGSATMVSSGGTVTITWTGQAYTSTSVLTLTGVSAAGGGGTFTTAVLSFAGPTDADVSTFNSYLTSLAGEFDGMVQVADIDTALGKSNQFFSFDGLHPNEMGAARGAQAVLSAVSRLSPTSPAGAAAQIQTPFPVVTPISRPYLNGQWYTSDTFGGVSATTYTPVIGDMWALPFFVTSGAAYWTQWSMVEATASAAPTVFMAIYDDRQLQGYPVTMFAQPANGTALSLLAAPGTFTSTTTAGTNGYLSNAMDPGLYWVVVKFATIGTCTFTTLHGPSLWLPNLSATGGSPGAGVSPCAWKLTGQGAGAIPTGRFPSGAVAADNPPLIGIKATIAQ